MFFDAVRREVFTHGEIIHFKWKLAHEINDYQCQNAWGEFAAQEVALTQENNSEEDDERSGWSDDR